MSKIYKNLADLVGKTPLLEIGNYSNGKDLKAKVVAKLEYFNPAGSVKDRIAKAMIEDAEKKGLLKADSVIIEPTSGNTGIGIASVGTAKGYKVIIVMPETMSVERRTLIKAYGAEIVLTEGAKGMKGAIAKAEELAAETQNSFIPGQFKNPANPEIHARTTGPEIWQATDGQVDILVAGVGTGGTITGISRYFEQVQNKPLYSVAVEPAESPIITQTKNGENITPAPHKIQGIGANFIPKNLDLDLVDEVLPVSSEEAIQWARNCATQEGILVGISSGAALAAAAKIAERPENAGKTIVVILPDSGERYLSSVLFEGLFDE